MAGVFYNERYGPPAAGANDQDAGEGYEGRMVAHQAQYLMQHAALIRNALNQSPLAAEGQFQLEQEDDLVTWDSGRYTIYLGHTDDGEEYGLTIYGQHPDMEEPLTPEALDIIKNILSQPHAGGRRRRRRKTKKHMKKRKTTRRK